MKLPRALKPYSAIERKFLEACCGGFDFKTQEQRPTEGTTENTIRAELVRFAALGGDDSCKTHERGIHVSGAWIEGDLDFFGCRVGRPFFLSACHLTGTVIIQGSTLEDFGLEGSLVHGISGNRCRVRGALLFREGFESIGVVELRSIKCDGVLTFRNSLITGDNKHAVRLSNSVFGNGVFFSNAKIVDGAITGLKVQIADDLGLSGLIIVGESKKISTVNFEYAEIGGALFMKEDMKAGREINFTGLKTYSLVDVPNSWQAAEGYRLDGMVYDRLGYNQTDAKKLIEWLRNQKSEKGYSFRPQPWEQAIAVLRSMGYSEDSVAVAIAKQIERRKQGQVKAIYRPFHWLYGAVAGYGYRPFRILVWMAGFWIAFAALQFNAANRGVIAPADPIIHAIGIGKRYDVSKCGLAGDVTSENYWTSCPDMPAEYATFSPLAYSADLILPLVDLQQDRDWAPAISNKKQEFLAWGWWARAAMWTEILIGWMLSLMFAAILGRLVEKD